MTELDRFAGSIIDSGSIIESYKATDNEKNPIYAFEVKFENTTLLLIFDEYNHCLGIIRK